MNSLQASKERLNDSLRQLSSRWEPAKEVWNDKARQDFHVEFWTEIETNTIASIDKLQELIDTLAQAEREMP